MQGRQMPQAPDAEQVVLGAILTEAKAFTRVESILSKESFYSEQHQVIYQAAKALHDNMQGIDLVTMFSSLNKLGSLEKAGGYLYLTELMNRVANTANLEHWARIVEQTARRREVIRAATEASIKAYDDTVDVFELANTLEATAATIAAPAVDMVPTVLQLSSSIAKAISEPEAEQGQVSCDSFLYGLNRTLGGYRAGELYIIAARPGMGKSALAMAEAYHTAVVRKKPVLVCSLEMASEQILFRLLCAERNIETWKVRKRQLSETDVESLLAELELAAAGKLHLNDSPEITLSGIRASCQQVRRANDGELGLVVIDYLQLIQSERRGNRADEVAHLSRGLKKLARQEQVPIIALSQLSRAVEQRGGDKRPTLADLRESGSIEQDADAVMLLYRPEYYGIQETSTGDTTAGQAEIILAKQREGQPATVKVRFEAKYVRFRDEATQVPFDFSQPSSRETEEIPF